MDPVNRLLIEAECTRLCVRFARHLDNGDFEAMFALFTPDGVFDRVGQVLNGHEEMRAAFGARPPGITSRHVVTNIDFLEVSDDHVEAHIYNLSFHAVGDAGAGPLTYATENARFLDFHDHYRLTDQGWRFASRTAGVVFVPRDWQE
ncbi:MAG TPA: nuclear transport factor 2 family protein [Pseudonocardia sp.]|jgi:3-phenylpropionate/cinnamic acid dioxygenase small subunit|nr:nuclear transport factor 2 family protein [Pseudonocardia sp.]